MSDRGIVFTSGEFADLLNSYSVKLIAVRIPRANGQIERVNRVLTPMPAKLSESPSKWEEILDVEYANNNTVCCSTGETLATFLFGIGQLGKNIDFAKKMLDQENLEERDLEKLRQNASKKLCSY